MKTCLALLSLIALGLVILPPCFAFDSGAGLSQAMKNLMLIGSGLWFAAATPLASLGQPASAGASAPSESR
jgi:hypothetical protein